MVVESSSATISGLTQGEAKVGTKIFLQWGNERTSEVKLTGIEVIYTKKSKSNSQ